VSEQTDAATAQSAAVAEELRAALRKLNRRLRDESSTGDFTESQKATLARLEEGPSTLSVLARAEGMRPQSMGTIITALTTSGLVEGAPHPTDGRQTLLSLTDTAREQLLAGRAARQDWLARSIHSHLSVAEQEQLSASIELVKRLIND
jgi:DNA-binding MarR family transcriptional regulator